MSSRSFSIPAFGSASSAPPRGHSVVRHHAVLADCVAPPPHERDGDKISCCAFPGQPGGNGGEGQGKGVFPVHRAGSCVWNGANSSSHVERHYPPPPPPPPPP